MDIKGDGYLWDIYREKIKRNREENQPGPLCVKFYSQGQMSGKNRKTLYHLNVHHEMNI
ncbi:hypothetical protein B4099_1755 [Heyndrickxia coagulans]|uniref:Uncharacterized protein n=1 Tax=Heyndrickxia coagulans TaxID=1398 RepID=A0A150KG48_HEYCO|nr:hypothetical protein B4099_1755 [Heyndrickxia coagulans]